MGEECYRRFVRWAFARFYHEFAWTYDAVAWLVSRGLWRSWVLCARPYLAGRVLELGSGTGHMQLALAAAYPGTAVGLDASPFMLALTRRRLRRAGMAGRLVRGVAQALPFAAATFDTVLATFPAEYILHPATAGEIRRLLRPGGRLVIVDMARFTGAGLYEWAVDLAYRLTLQASVRQQPVAARPFDALAAAGFALTATWETVGPSRVMVMVGVMRSA